MKYRIYNVQFGHVHGYLIDEDNFWDTKSEREASSMLFISLKAARKLITMVSLNPHNTFRYKIFKYDE